MKTQDEGNVYRKNPDGSYSAVGLFCDKEYLTDGYWYVRHHEHSWGISNGAYLEGLFKLNDRDEALDPKITMGLSDLADKVLNDPEFMDYWFDTGKPRSAYEDICKVISTIMKVQNKENG